MIEKIGIVAEGVVARMSRRNFVRKLGAGAAGLVAALAGTPAFAYPKPMQCCYYNCRTANRSIFYYVAQVGCFGCDLTKTINGINGCKLIDFKCIQTNQKC